MRPSDDGLAARYVLGSDASLRQLFRRHHTLMYGLALCVMGDAAHAEDSAEKAFVRACSVLLRYR